MGTTWSVRGYADAATVCLLRTAIDQTLDAIIQQMSQWEASSILSRFNAAPRGAVFEAPPLMHDVLCCALDVCTETDGAFDPTLGALADFWGFGATGLGGAQELGTGYNATERRLLDYDRETRRLTQSGAQKLDLSGIAKGYAVDEVARVVNAAGVQSFLVEIGGEVAGAGVKPDGQPWWVEFERPPGARGEPIVAALYNLAVATSGDYRRTVARGAHVYSHTFDPRTGEPLKNDVASVTVLHANCMRADAYATALMVMGPEAGRAFADQHDLPAVFTLRRDGAVVDVFSEAFRRNL